MDLDSIATIVSAIAGAVSAWVAWKNWRDKANNPSPSPDPSKPPKPKQTLTTEQLENTRYQKLRDFLDHEKFKEADQETFRLMLQVACREEAGYLRIKDIEQFPFSVLCTIDRFWVNSSKGHFGFSVQKQILNKAGKKYLKLAEKVGWRVDDKWLEYKDYTFSLDAPLGHLPSWNACPMGFSIRLGRHSPSHNQQSFL